MRFSFTKCTAMLLATLSCHSWGIESDGHLLGTDTATKGPFNDGPVFKALPGKKVPIFIFNRTTNKCEHASKDDGSGKFEQPYFVSDDRMASGEIEEPYAPSLEVDEALYEEFKMHKVDWVIVKDASPEEGDAEVFYCISLKSLKELSGFHYKHRYSTTGLPPETSPKALKGAPIEIQYRQATNPITKIPSVSLKSNAPGSAPTQGDGKVGTDERIGLLPRSMTPKSVPSYGTAFYKLSDKNDPKTIYWLSSKLIDKSTKKVATHDEYDPTKNYEEGVDASQHNVEEVAEQKPAPPVEQKVPDPEGSFVAELKKRVANPNAKLAGITLSAAQKFKIGRKKYYSRPPLVKLPLREGAKTGPCGSFHYTPDAPPGADAFATPTASCLFSASLQEWKKSYCKNSELGCRMSFGDFAHEDKYLFNTHKSHGKGNCVDIRPPREGNFADSPMTKSDSNYNRDTTTKMVKLFKKWGATTVYFNDSNTGANYWTGHDNHLHVCFPETASNKSKCINNFKVDPNVCPELAKPTPGWVY